MVSGTNHQPKEDKGAVSFSKSSTRGMAPALSGGQSASTSGSAGSPSSRSEQATAGTPASESTFVRRLKHLEVNGDEAGSSLGATSSKKKKRGARAVTGDKSGRGLRQFSMKVCEKVESKGRTTYNEVADELVAEFADPNNNMAAPDQQQYDEKNIRRRVYDALNVLMAMDIISKDKKEIQWKGLPRTTINDVEELKAERASLKGRIEKKTAYLQELEDQMTGLQNLIQRNEQLHGSGNIPSGGVALPFILVQVAYEQWFTVFLMYPQPLVKRAKQLWSAIRSWMAANFPEANETLRRGATEAEISLAEEKLGVKFPMSTRVLYRFCDGQDTLTFDSLHERYLAPLGIIGGYEFYDHSVNVHLLSLSQIVRENMVYRRAMGFRSKNIIIIVMSNHLQKRFFLNCVTGQLYVGTRDLPSESGIIPCVPSTLIIPMSGALNGLPQSGLMLWLEEHCRRLYSGVIRTRMVGRSRSICLYPEPVLETNIVGRSHAGNSELESLPICSTAVTNGVQVHASAVFVPELSVLEEDEEYYYSYSIRMSLQPEECFLNGIHYSSCQLSSRHWIIRARDNVVADVSGEGVIGKYPLLMPDQEEFVYESCTPLLAPLGSIEGSFTFVPGRLAHPEGTTFEVKVTLFILEVPDYIF